MILQLRFEEICDVMDEKKKVSWNLAKSLVQSHAQISDVREALSKLTKQEIEDTYEDELNLLHYTVLSNNLQVARLLFEKECFLQPHEYETVPYLHIACFKGFSDMVELLIKKRPDDDKVKVSANDENWRKFLAANSLKGDENEELLATYESKNEDISAYDVAALCHQMNCLKSLLKERTHGDWLGKMVELEEPRALAYLFDTEMFELADLTLAFCYSLCVASPSCLEIILKYAAQNDVFFTEDNPYLILYTSDNSRLCSSRHPLLECTRLLIQYGWDVNVMEAQVTFPLYCLLRRIMDYDETRFHGSMSKSLDEEFACLSALLAAGADPNKDEKSNCCLELPESNFAERKPAFSSAAEALVYLIPQILSPCRTEFVSQTASLLAKYGCHMKGQRSWLGKMVQMDQADGLKLLLDFFDFNSDSLNYGLETSLYETSHCCLKTILQYAAEKGVTFHQKNPLHFMYLYTFDKGWLASNSPAKCTRALIDYGWNVNVTHSPASYPLYTLLWSITASYDSHRWGEAREVQLLEEAFSCLRELLEGKVNPNFCETSRAPRVNGTAAVSAFEKTLIHHVRNNCEKKDRRKPYFSAAAALMDILDFCELDPYFVDFISRSVLLLVQHGADVTYINCSGQSLLHRFLGCISPTYEFYESTEAEIIEAVKHVGLVMRNLLAGGADINAKDCFSKLPLTYFCEKLSEDTCCFLCNIDVEDKGLELLLARLKPIFRCVDVMEIKEAQEVVTQFVEAFDYCSHHIDFDLSPSVLDYLKEEVQSHVRVRSLYCSCLIKVWRYCSYKLAKTKDLGLPINIERDLNEMLSF